MLPVEINVIQRPEPELHTLERALSIYTVHNARIWIVLDHVYEGRERKKTWKPFVL